MSIKKDGQEGNATTMIPAQGSQASTPPKPGSPAPLFNKPLPVANDGRTAVFKAPAPRVIDGRYTLLDLLGEGGMGQVYCAQDQQLDEVVALKMLHPDLLSKEEAVHRFKQEARLARRVTHPNVARTFDLGEADGTLYLTMEFVKGESLSDRLKRQRTLHLEETVALALAICAGLEAAHQQSIIHRDLKPDNILLADDGRAVLTDFGIARLESGDSHFKTAMGVVVGTPTYMAPEQIEGKGKIDARTDLYALGCILFEMLAGNPAWLGNDFIVLATARFMQPPPDVRTRRSDVPEAMAELILRCMARQPDKRFSSATEVIQALQGLTSTSIAQPTRNFLTQLPAGGTSPSPTYPPWSTAAGLAALAPQTGQVQVAVLPFQNRGNTTEAHILEGLMDDLIDTLSMTEGLDVRALGMVKSYKGNDVEPTEAGRELGVDVIISGSIQTMGEQLKIRTQLISTHDGNQLWAQRFPCKTSDFFDVSDGIAQEVAKALKVDLSLPQRSASQDSAAIDLYLRGRYELRRCWTADVTPAIQLFDQARELSPEDPKILSGAAIARARFAFWSHFQNEELQPARLLAERAYAVAPEQPEALFALAMVRSLEERLAEAIRLLEQAIALNPTYEDAHDLLGRILLEIGPLDKATHHLRLALGLDATLLSARWDLMRAYGFQQQWERLEDLCILPVSEPMDVAVRAIVASRLLLWHPTPKPFTVLPEMEAPFITPSVLRYQRVVAQGELSKKEHQESLRLIEEANSPRLKTLLLQFMAEQLAFSQKWDACMDAIQESINRELWDRIWLQHCPLFQPLQGNTRFQSLQQSVEEKLAPRLATH